MKKMAGMPKRTNVAVKEIGEIDLSMGKELNFYAKRTTELLPEIR